MLKLKHLFDNRDLAIMLLSYWDYNPSKIDDLSHFRISSNAVYPFVQMEQRCFLRFAPIGEKQPQMVQAELDFLRYLRKNGYPAAETVMSKDNREIVISETPWGKYVAVAFKGVSGQRLDRIEYSDNLYHGYGKMLGQLHLLSKQYVPSIKRPDWRQSLELISDILRKYTAPETALKEVSILEAFFSKLPETTDNYGLVHYDFEPDNVFFDDVTLQYSVIDFDDSMNHWFALDIEQAAGSIMDELPETLHGQAVRQFIDGYRTVTDMDESTTFLMPVFRRYINLYGYARCLRSMHEQWDNEPDWMVGLRRHIASGMDKKIEGFGTEIVTAI